MRWSFEPSSACPVRKPMLDALTPAAPRRPVPRPFLQQLPGAQPLVLHRRIVSAGIAVAPLPSVTGHGCAPVGRLAAVDIDDQRPFRLFGQVKSGVRILGRSPLRVS